jgi:enamine deaminase RidA (YjgF/YER057c/UK114 family)
MTHHPAPSDRLVELGLSLPAVPTPAGAYVPAVRVGDLVYTAGQLPFVDGALPATGLVGAEVSAEQAARLARTAVINAVAAVADIAGGIDTIGQIVKVVVFVASAPGFVAQPAVANGASDLLGALFGPAGRHARSAVGVAVLPLNSPVEVELVAQLHATPTIRPL